MTCIACAGGDAVRMESGFLVEKDGECAVVGTEDVAAVATMMSAVENVEGGAAFGGVAVGGLLVGLFGRVSLELGGSRRDHMSFCQIQGH